MGWIGEVISTTNDTQSCVFEIWAYWLRWFIKFGYLDLLKMLVSSCRGRRLAFSVSNFDMSFIFFSHPSF